MSNIEGVGTKAATSATSTNVQTNVRTKIETYNVLDVLRPVS